MLIRMYQIEISRNDKLLKRSNWGGPELLTLSLEKPKKSFLGKILKITDFRGLRIPNFCNFLPIFTSSRPLKFTKMPFTTSYMMIL